MGKQTYVKVPPLFLLSSEPVQPEHLHPGPVPHASAQLSALARWRCGRMWRATACQSIS